MPDRGTGPDRLRVLVVDDDEHVAGAVARVLGEVYDVLVATSVAAAQQLLDEHACHIVVSDVSMPERTGVDLYEWLIDRSPKLAERVVFVTGGVTDARAAAVLAATPNARLAKPFNSTELRRVVDAIAARISFARPGSPS